MLTLIGKTLIDLQLVQSLDRANRVVFMDGHMVQLAPDEADELRKRYRATVSPDREQP